MNSTFRYKKKLISLLTIIALSQGLYGAPSANAACLSESDLRIQVNADGVYETCGGDDSVYRIPFAGSVVFGGVTYSTIYATTNSVITFGEEDDTYDEFPNAPSISIESQDWVVDEMGTDVPDEFLIITVSGETFRVDLSARPYDTYWDNEPDSYGATTRRTLNFERQVDGTLRIFLTLSNGSNDSGLRSGCVLSEGAEAISLADCGIIRVASPGDYLVTTTPLIVSQTNDEVICTSAGLKYVQGSALEMESQLTAQTYFLQVNGEVVAKKESLEGVATFKKSVLPINAVVTCSQVSAQGNAHIIVGSENQSVYDAAAKVRKAEIRKILADYYSESQRLLKKKLSYLSTNTSVKYSVAVENWKADLFVAQSVRDLAIKAAYEKEAQVGFVTGMKVTIKK